MPTAVDARGRRRLETFARLAAIPDDQVQRLIDHLGGIPEALGATHRQIEILCGRRTASLLVAARELSLSLLEGQMAERPAIGSMADVADWLRLAGGYRPRETIHVFFLDHQRKLLDVQCAGVGSRTGSEVDVPGLLMMAHELGATAFIIAHNHPSGDPRPSVADIAVTRRIEHAAAALDLVLIDHLVVAGREVYSIFGEDLLADRAYQGGGPD